MMGFNGPMRRAGGLGEVADGGSRRSHVVSVSPRAGTPTAGHRAGRPAGRTLASAVARRLALFLVLFAIALWLFDRAVAAEATDRAADVAVDATREALREHLTDQLIAGDPATMGAMGEAVVNFAERDHIARLKVWATDGTIVWADEPSLIGERFELDPDEAALFETQGSVASMSDLSDPENVLEAAQASEMLEVYVGFRTDGGVPLLVETYFAPRFVAEVSDDLRSRFLPLLLGSFGVVLLLQAVLSVTSLRRLLRARDEREELLQRLVETSDTERRRIAAEVHDGAVQDLIGIAYSLKAAARRDGADADELAALAATTEHTVRSLRGLLSSIYPVSVPPEGWIAGLDDLVEILRERGVAVSFEVDADPPRSAEQLFLRTAREALRNVVKHSVADEVVVRVRSAGRALTLEVADNGQGFDADGLRPGGTDGHFGLGLLADLARDSGADLEMASSPGTGTTVRLTVGGGIGPRIGSGVGPAIRAGVG